MEFEVDERAAGGGEEGGRGEGEMDWILFDATKWVG